MGALAAKYPDDLHALTLYAESLMDRMPWAYWNDDGTPKEMTPALVAALEKVLAGDPEHPSATHLYIHTMEQFTPKKAEAAADRLGDLCRWRGLALETAERLREQVPVEFARKMGAIQAYLPVRMFTFARFGM